MKTQEPWLRGPLEGITPGLQPVAHALLFAREELDRLLTSLTRDQVWQTPGGIASIGYHVRHCFGSLERLLTYARGESLSEAQFEALAREKMPDPKLTAGDLLQIGGTGIERAMQQLRVTPESVLNEPRAVGRMKLPSTVRGLLFQAAEHTARHVGQIATTAKLLRASSELDG